MNKTDKPLTLEQLRQMNGQPVRYEATGEVFIVDINNPDFGDCVVNANGYYIPLRKAVDRSIGRRFFKYDRPRIDREKWEPCEHCITCRTCRHILKSIANEPCLSCKRYSNHDPMPFCSRCGRPLTDEAWAELERRVSGG